MRLCVVMTVLLGVIGCAGPNLVWGADLPVPPATAPAVVVPPPPSAYNWSGFYLGGNAGFGFASAAATASAPGLSVTSSETLSGFVGGGQVGFNFQSGAFVFGIEGDIDGSLQSKTSTAPGVSVTDSIPWLGTLRGRAGVAFNRILLYGTGGAGWGEFDVEAAAAGLGSASGSQSHFAWVAGAGIEGAITDTITARLEYLYLDTGTVNLGSFAGVAATGRVQDSMVRAGLNFKFPVAF